MLELHVLGKWVIRFYALSHSGSLPVRGGGKVSAVSSLKNEPVIVLAN